jgi:hypothetical protein
MMTEIRAGENKLPTHILHTELRAVHHNPLARQVHIVHSPPTLYAGRVSMSWWKECISLLSVTEAPKCTPPSSTCMYGHPHSM